MTEIDYRPKYPDALSIRLLEERGFTFLHRVFQKNIDTQKPVIIKTGDAYLQYNYDQTHTKFVDGIIILENDAKDSIERFFQLQIISN